VPEFERSRCFAVLVYEQARPCFIQHSRTAYVRISIVKLYTLKCCIAFRRI
jgi:hypothetical protein